MSVVVAPSPEGSASLAPPSTVLPPLASRSGAATSKPWLDWATLLRRTYDLDVLACPCGGRLRMGTAQGQQAQADGEGTTKVHAVSMM